MSQATRTDHRGWKSRYEAARTTPQSVIDAAQNARAVTITALGANPQKSHK
jgi:hypothetical protein